MPDKTPRLAMFMRRLLEAVKDVKQAIHAENKTLEEKRNVPAEMRAEVRFDEQTIRDTKTDQDRQYRIQRSIRNTARAAVIAASIYAFFAAWQVYEMRRATRFEERAWVGLTGFNIGSQPPGQPTLGPIVSDVPIHANFVLENFGKTPAEIDGIGMKLEVRNSPVPDRFEYGLQAEKRGWVIFPARTMQTVDTDYTISKSDFLAVEQNPSLEWGKGSLVLHGVIKYHDVFGNHLTKVCLIWRPGQAVGDKAFNNCIEHNGAN